MIHKRCNFCKKIGHKPDMLKHVWHGKFYIEMGASVYTDYYHEKCYIKNFNVKKVYSLSEKKYVWVSNGKKKETK